MGRLFLYKKCHPYRVNKKVTRPSSFPFSIFYSVFKQLYYNFRKIQYIIVKNKSNVSKTRGGDVKKLGGCVKTLKGGCYWNGCKKAKKGVDVSKNVSKWGIDVILLENVWLWFFKKGRAPKLPFWRFCHFRFDILTHTPVLVRFHTRYAKSVLTHFWHVKFVILTHTPLCIRFHTGNVKWFCRCIILTFWHFLTMIYWIIFLHSECCIFLHSESAFRRIFEDSKALILIILIILIILL